MGKLDVDNSLVEVEDFDDESDAEPDSGKIPPMTKDMRRRLEEKLDDARLSRELREYDFKGI
ncbi:MAG TPA: hypothetical protein PLF22_02055 [Pseudomonadales bacterium]|nr:hypothetical protein [Pseudomonadales bacterium]